jgi:hypothetical protein
VFVRNVLVEAAQRDDGFVERLARNEPRGAEPHPVPPDDPLDPRAVRGREDRPAQG